MSRQRRLFPNNGMWRTLDNSIWRSAFSYFTSINTTKPIPAHIWHCYQQDEQESGKACSSWTNDDSVSYAQWCLCLQSNCQTLHGMGWKVHLPLQQTPEHLLCYMSPRMWTRMLLLHCLHLETLLSLIMILMRALKVTEITEGLSFWCGLGIRSRGWCRCTEGDDIHVLEPGFLSFDQSCLNITAFWDQICQAVSVWMKY